MKLWSYTPDLSKAQTLVYHLPDGRTVAIPSAGVAHLFELSLEMFQICDTSEIDGVIHFFPRGHA
jgi:hypothetical protein